MLSLPHSSLGAGDYLLQQSPNHRNNLLGFERLGQIGVGASESPFQSVKDAIAL